MTTYAASTPYIATNQYGAAPQIVTQVPTVAAVPATTTTTTTTAVPRTTRTVFIGKHWSAFAILLALVATILYIIALVTPAFFADYNGNGIGLYKTCAIDQSPNKNQYCGSISDSCTMTLAGGVQQHQISSCDKFRAMRGLEIAAVVLAGLCVLMMLFTHYRQSRYELSSALIFLSMTAGLIVTAIAIDYYIQDIRSDDTVNHFASSLGYSFIIGTIAWILQLIALCAFSSTHYSTRYNTMY